MRELKVWGGSYDGMYRVIVATKTKKRAIELFGISYSRFKDYYCETKNEQEIVIATSKPNTVFRTKDNDNWREKYFEKEKR